MSHFFADWDYTSHPHVVRKDTRIFWSSGCHDRGGRCVGTFIGENPGSAEARHRMSDWDELVTGTLPGDPTVRCILEAWQQGVKSKVSAPGCAEEPKPDDYIEVLNMYYFRSATSMALLADWRSCGGASIYFQLPSPTSRFVIIGWGQKMNTQPEATRLGLSVLCHPVLTADCNGLVRPPLTPPLLVPLQPYPAHPSGIAQRGHKKTFISNLAAALYPFI